MSINIKNVLTSIGSSAFAFAILVPLSKVFATDPVITSLTADQKVSLFNAGVGAFTTEFLPIMVLITPVIVGFAVLFLLWRIIKGFIM